MSSYHFQIFLLKTSKWSFKNFHQQAKAKFVYRSTSLKILFWPVWVMLPRVPVLLYYVKREILKCEPDAKHYKNGSFLTLWQKATGSGPFESQFKRIMTTSIIFEDILDRQLWSTGRIGRLYAILVGIALTMSLWTNV